MSGTRWGLAALGGATLIAAGPALSREEGQARHFQIQFDYRFDHEGYFDAPERRALLDAAARMWEKRLLDDFETVPAGTRILVMNPRTLREEAIILTEPVDDLIVFVGTNRTLDDRMAVAAPSTRWYRRGDGHEYPVRGRERIEGADFEPWAGFLAVNPTPPIPYFFDDTPETDVDVPQNSYKSYDFLGLAMHELGHILGVGTSPAFRSLSSMTMMQGLTVKNDASGRAILVSTNYSLFFGPRARSLNRGEPITLSADLGHLRTRFLAGGQQDLMDADLNRSRQLPTAIDLALLEDIGYEIPQEYFNLSGWEDNPALRASL